MAVKRNGLGNAAPPKPCMTRARLSICSESERAQNSEDNRKTG